MFPVNSKGIIWHILLQTDLLIIGRIIVKIVSDSMNQLWKQSDVDF